MIKPNKELILFLWSVLLWSFADMSNTTVTITEVKDLMSLLWKPIQKFVLFYISRIMEWFRFRSSCSLPLLKQGHLEPVAQDHVQMAFEYLQGLHNLTRQVVPVTHTVKNWFLIFRGNFCVSFLCQLCLDLTLGTS